MPEISLSDFVDFVAKTGTPRLTHVRTIKERGAYDPAQDFWRRLRDGIVDYHRTNQQSKAWLDTICAGLTDTKKRNNYPNAVGAYKAFLGRKTVAWFKPQSRIWQYGGLDIRINPELGLAINGDRHHLKLYFKGTALRKDKADMILLLLQEGLTSVQAGDKFAILDVQNKRLFADDAPDGTNLPLLQGEATSFSAIWNALP